MCLKGDGNIYWITYCVTQQTFKSHVWSAVSTSRRSQKARPLSTSYPVSYKILIPRSVSTSLDGTSTYSTLFITAMHNLYTANFGQNSNLYCLVHCLQTQFALFLWHFKILLQICGTIQWKHSLGLYDQKFNPPKGFKFAVIQTKTQILRV